MEDHFCLIAEHNQPDLLDIMTSIEDHLCIYIYMQNMTPDTLYLVRIWMCICIAIYTVRVLVKNPKA